MSKPDRSTWTGFTLNCYGAKVRFRTFAATSKERAAHVYARLSMAEYSAPSNTVEFPLRIVVHGYDRPSDSLAWYRFEVRDHGEGNIGIRFIGSEWLVYADGEEDTMSAAKVFASCAADAAQRYAEMNVGKRHVVRHKSGDTCRLVYVNGCWRLTDDDKPLSYLFKNAAEMVKDAGSSIVTHAPLAKWGDGDDAVTVYVRRVGGADEDWLTWLAYTVEDGVATLSHDAVQRGKPAPRLPTWFVRWPLRLATTIHAPTAELAVSEFVQRAREHEIQFGEGGASDLRFLDGEWVAVDKNHPDRKTSFAATFFVTEAKVLALGARIVSAPLPKSRVQVRMVETQAALGETPGSLKVAATVHRYTELEVEDGDPLKVREVRPRAACVDPVTPKLEVERDPSNPEQVQVSVGPRGDELVTIGFAEWIQETTTQAAQGGGPATSGEVDRIRERVTRALQAAVADGRVFKKNDGVWDYRPPNHDVKAEIEALLSSLAGLTPTHIETREGPAGACTTARFTGSVADVELIVRVKPRV